ncbi:MAG: hypothetical protein IJH63_01160 [Methanobrevibacter sp.]|nr:hypothetical protein [Methanobrevibacter sp.]
MAKIVLIPSLVAAKNIDSLNQSFLDSSNDYDNGMVFKAGAYDSAKQTYTPAAIGSGELHDVYMAFSPEDSIMTDEMGNQYKIGLNDPRNFTNSKGLVFSAYRPQVGDKILISANGIEGTADDYAVVAAGETKLQYASAAVSGLSYKVLDDSAYISIGGASAIGTQRVAAVLLECVAI